MTRTAQVHRFRDLIALSMPHHVAGETVYLEPKEAAKLAKLLTEGARSVRNTPFTESTFGTRSLPLNENMAFKQVRK